MCIRDRSCSMDVSTVRNNTRYINRGTDKMPEIVQPTKEPVSYTHL